MPKFSAMVQQPAADKIVLELQAMQTRARAAGLYVTARALNRAINTAGWEMAGDVLKAGEAMIRDHV